MSLKKFCLAFLFATIAGYDVDRHRYGLALASALGCLIVALDGVADRLGGRTP